MMLAVPVEFCILNHSGVGVISYCHYGLTNFSNSCWGVWEFIGIYGGASQLDWQEGASGSGAFYTSFCLLFQAWQNTTWVSSIGEFSLWGENHFWSKRASTVVVKSDGKHGNHAFKSFWSIKLSFLQHHHCRCAVPYLWYLFLQFTEMALGRRMGVLQNSKIVSVI